MASGVSPDAGQQLPAVQRAEAFAQGPPRVPSRFLRYLLGIIVVLGAGGVGLDRAFSAMGLNPSSSVSSPPSTSPDSPALPAAGPPGTAAPLASGEPALMDLTRLDARPAPAISLSTAPGTPLNLDQLRGKVVVLSFFNEPCNDICPIVAAEMAQADVYLGRYAGSVEFVTIDSDPLSPGKWPSVVRVFGGRPAPANWMFATGTLSQLNRAWVAYGVTVDVVRSSQAVTHSDLLYFVDPTGRLRYMSTPFANEVSAGEYTLPAETVSRWAHGMADVAIGLLT